MYYKACTKHYSTHNKLLHTTSFYTQQALTHNIFFTEKLLYTTNFPTQQAFTHRTLIKQRSFYTQIIFYTQQAFTQRSFYTQQIFTHNKYLYTEHFYIVLLHMASICTHRKFYTETLLHTEKILLTANFYTHVFICNNFLHFFKTQRNFFVHNYNRNCSSKTGSRRQSEKMKYFLEELLKWKLLAPKLRQSADKSLSQPGCSHSNTI